MDTQFDDAIRNMLLGAAGRKHTIPYEAFHTVFPATMAVRLRHTVLERVAASICALQEADYACLLSAASGLPGQEFFERFRRLHPERYYAPLGADRTRQLKLVEKRQFAQEARREVYRHYRITYGMAMDASIDALAIRPPDAAGIPSRNTATDAWGNGVRRAV